MLRPASDGDGRTDHILHDGAPGDGVRVDARRRHVGAAAARAGLAAIVLVPLVLTPIHGFMLASGSTR